MKSEVVIAVLLRIHIFWDVVLCHWGGVITYVTNNSAFTFKSQVVQEGLGRFFLDCPTLKMKVQ